MGRCIGECRGLLLESSKKRRDAHRAYGEVYSGGILWATIEVHVRLWGGVYGEWRELLLLKD